MKKLETEFTKNEMFYQLVKRTDMVAMYSLDYGSSYEVFDIPVVPAQKAFGKHYPKRELIPSNEDFGRKFRSKAFINREQAEVWYTILVNNPIKVRRGVERKLKAS